MAQKIRRVEWSFCNPGWIPNALLCLFVVDFDTIQASEYFSVISEEVGNEMARQREQWYRKRNDADLMIEKIRHVLYQSGDEELEITR